MSILGGVKFGNREVNYLYYRGMLDIIKSIKRNIWELDFNLFKEIKSKVKF